MPKMYRIVVLALAAACLFGTALCTSNDQSILQLQRQLSSVLEEITDTTEKLSLLKSLQKELKKDIKKAKRGYNDNTIAQNTKRKTIEKMIGTLSGG